jgi:dihydroorotase
MKQNVKIFLIALGIGMISAFVVCYKIEPTIISNALETKVTYFYVGSYNDITSANNKKSNYTNALIYNSDSIYSVIIGVYNKKESIELMESYFLDKGINFRKKEVKASQELIKAMRDYELLIATSDKNYYENLNKSLLKLFSEYINK